MLKNSPDEHKNNKEYISRKRNKSSRTLTMNTNGNKSLPNCFKNMFPYVSIIDFFN